MQLFRLAGSILCVLLLQKQMAVAQPIAAYTDVRGRFHAFYNGQTIQLTHLPPQHFFLGKKYIAYIDNGGRFHYYIPAEHGIHPVLLSQGVNTVKTSEHLLTYESYGQLKTVDKQQPITLTANLRKWDTGDSIVCWFDGMQRQLNVYHDGKITTIADALINKSLLDFKVADNLVAYVDAYDQLIVYFRHTHTTLCQTESPIHYKVGKNIVAYIDKSYGTFQTFYKGDIIELSPFRPISFKTADNRIAFVDNSGIFKLFDKNKQYEISSFSPDKYWLTDSLVVYTENQQLYLFHKNNSIFLENYLPENIKVFKNLLCYRDNMDRLILFCNGKKQILSYDPPTRFFLYYNTVIFYTGNGQPNIHVCKPNM